MLSVRPADSGVNSIAPSYVYEDVNKAYFDWIAQETGRTHEEVYAEKAAPTDLKRLASPEEVARASLFFASDLASAVTGTVLNVNVPLLAVSVTCMLPAPTSTSVTEIRLPLPDENTSGVSCGVP